jgi:hypothetical protein
VTEGSPVGSRAPEERPLALEELSREPAQQLSAPEERPHAREDRKASFAHASEAELSRILDYYQVRWEYEPRSFPILWTLEGKVVESFAPDFYLPDLDLYVELTTLKQTLVRKKNRKLRRLRELYPEIRIKLFYAKDFRALMLKYGKIALAAELSGAGGQFGLPDAVLAVRAAALQSADSPTALPAGASTPDPPTQLSRPKRRPGAGRSAARKAVRPTRDG